MFRLLAFKGAVAKFPPTFEGNPFTYAFALFALALISAMSLSLLIHFALESRRHWQIHKLIGNCLRVLKQNLKLILLVLLIAVGVTVGKASV